MAAQLAEKRNLQQAPDRRHNHHRAGYSHRQWNIMRQRHGHHPAQHYELALGEIQHPGGAVDQVEPDRHYGIDAALGDAG